MAPRIRTLEAQRATVSTALDGGAIRKTATSFYWDVAGRCEQPVSVELIGKPSAGLFYGPNFLSDSKYVTIRPGGPTPLFLDAEVPCRKCPACLKNRANYWRLRAMSEIKNSARTWFVTLTLRPERAFYYLELMRHNLTARGVDPYVENSEFEFRAHCLEVGREVTRFIKRVRKNSGAKLRYCFVFERHKSGCPHVHGLVHEVVGNDPVTKRCIQGAWHDGFSHCKLVPLGDETRIAFYVTKYITKEACVRIRASQKYGFGEQTLTPLMRQSIAFGECIENMAERRATRPKDITTAGSGKCGVDDLQNGTQSRFEPALRSDE